MPTDDDQLLGLLGDALTPADRPPPTDRVEAVRRAAAEHRPSAPEGPVARRTGGRRLALTAAAVVVVALGIGAVLGALVGGDDADDDADTAAGVVEYDGAMAGPEGAAAEVTVTRTGIGREVHLRTDELAILPPGEFYEVWFVGPGDTPAAPNRISAGTFHPDEQGRTDVQFAAAVDPALFGTLVVTAEAGDGDPSPSGPEVLRAEISVD